MEPSAAATVPTRPTLAKRPDAPLVVVDVEDAEALVLDPLAEEAALLDAAEVAEADADVAPEAAEVALVLPELAPSTNAWTVELKVPVMLDKLRSR